MTSGVNVFVSGMPRDYTEANLKQLCEPCGTLSSVKIMLDAKTGKSRGFGFALFHDAAAAHHAVNSLNGYLLGGHRLHAELSKHRAGEFMQRSCKILVRNIPREVTSEEVRAFFSAFGPVLEGNMKKDLENRYMAVLTFSTEDEAAAAVQGSHGQKPFALCDAPLLTKLFQPASTRSGREAGATVPASRTSSPPSHPPTPPNGLATVLPPVLPRSSSQTSATAGWSYSFDPYSATCVRRFHYG